MLRTLLNGAVFTVGFVAMLAGLGCAFLTFATNDYRPIMVSGIGLAALATTCFGLLIWRERGGLKSYTAVGILPSLLALGNCVSRLLFILAHYDF